MNILVTGATGFLGQHLMDKFRSLDHHPYSIPFRFCDLRSPTDVYELFECYEIPDIIFHLAADVGGIEYNFKNPASIYYNNVMMNTLLINKACQVGVKKLVFIGSVCSYPWTSRLPIDEEWLDCGPLEETNEAYGASKLMALTHLRACRKQYGLNFAYPILANLYGPGDGGFFEDDKSHVISALVKKIVMATMADIKTVEVWGDGSATRDLLYVEDAATALTKFLEVDYNEPVNIATGQEVKISEIIELIIKYTGYEGEVRYSIDKPTGQSRRCYDVSRAKKHLGWQAEIDIEEGLKRTVEWYKQL